MEEKCKRCVGELEEGAIFGLCELCRAELQKKHYDKEHNPTFLERIFG